MSYIVQLLATMDSEVRIHFILSMSLPSRWFNYLFWSPGVSFTLASLENSENSGSLRIMMEILYSSSASSSNYSSEEEGASDE